MSIFYENLVTYLLSIQLHFS